MPSECMRCSSTTYLGAINSGAGGDALGIKSMHVLASGKHIRVPDRISARAREDELAVKGLDKSAKLVVSHDLRQSNHCIPRQACGTNENSSTCKDISRLLL